VAPIIWRPTTPQNGLLPPANRRQQGIGFSSTGTDEVVDLLASGLGVFGIALGRIWREVDGTLADLSPETTMAAIPGTNTTDRQRGWSEMVS